MKNQVIPPPPMTENERAIIEAARAFAAAFGNGNGKWYGAERTALLDAVRKERWGAGTRV